MLDLKAIEATKLVEEPFPYMLVNKAMDPASLEAVQKDFPSIQSPGIFPLSEVAAGPSFNSLVKEIQGLDLRHAIEQKFKVDLEGKPLMITVRGMCQKKDGRIHTDSKDKVITCLLYLNEQWEEGGGRLRLLKSESDLEDMIAEVPPDGGTLLVFKRTDRSWHGHYPFEGERRCIMFNWLTSNEVLHKNQLRHKLSAKIKKYLPFKKINQDY